MIIINYEIKNKITSLPKNFTTSSIYITCMKEFWKKWRPNGKNTVMV